MTLCRCLLTLLLAHHHLFMIKRRSGGHIHVNIFYYSYSTLMLFRAVKTFLGSRLVMNRRRLWNSHQRHKFLRAETSRDILKFRISEMAFSVIFKRSFPPRTKCFFIRIHARLGMMPSKCPRRSTTSHGSHVSQG